MAHPSEGKVPKHGVIKPFRAALVRALKIADNDPEQLDNLAQSLINQARAGDLMAIKEIADRLDGKPAQAHTGEDGGPMQLVVVTGVPRADAPADR